MADIVEDTKGKIRDLPIAEKLRQLLVRAGTEAEVDRIRVFSGGQCAIGKCNKRTGTTRHDLGLAADLELWKNGRALDFTSAAELPIFMAFVTAAARLGATGIGAGIGYMGPFGVHVGYGVKAVWGKKNTSPPAWLVEAAQRGWSNSRRPIPTPYMVVARNGLRLRSGPGTEFDVVARLDGGVVVNIDGFDGADSEWARVDLQGDGLIDGHVLKAFLLPVATDSVEAQDDCSIDNVEESN